jgi:uncharacterized protein (DUF169 family)
MTIPDFSIFAVIGFDYPVVAVKFSAVEPADLPRLNKRLAFCEMLKEAQDAGGFYATMDEHSCKVGPYVLGQIPHDPVAESGRIGPMLGVYESADANRRLYSDMLRFPVGSATYTLFSRLDDLRFEPDLIVITATPSQAEIVTRAHSYSTGTGWETRGTTVAGCACLYAYPHLTGKLNMLVSGLHHGMKARNLFPQGLLLISIPSPLLPMIVDNLRTMAAKNQIDLPQYHWGKDAHEKHMRELVQRLTEEMVDEATSLTAT